MFSIDMYIWCVFEFEFECHTWMTWLVKFCLLVMISVKASMRAAESSFAENAVAPASLAIATRFSKTKQEAG